MHYQLFIKDKSTGKVNILKETYIMRYLFMPEIIHWCENEGFKLLDVKEWMTDKEPGLDT